MKAKYTANWGVQIAGMIFQTLSKVGDELKAEKNMLYSMYTNTNSLSTANTEGIILYFPRKNMSIFNISFLECPQSHEFTKTFQIL